MVFLERVLFFYQMPRKTGRKREFSKHIVIYWYERRSTTNATDVAKRLAFHHNTIRGKHVQREESVSHCRRCVHVCGVSLPRPIHLTDVFGLRGDSDSLPLNYLSLVLFIFKCNILHPFQNIIYSLSWRRFTVSIFVNFFYFWKSIEFISIFPLDKISIRPSMHPLDLQSPWNENDHKIGSGCRKEGKRERERETVLFII